MSTRMTILYSLVKFSPKQLDVYKRQGHHIASVLSTDCVDHTLHRQLVITIRAMYFSDILKENFKYISLSSF